MKTGRARVAAVLAAGGKGERLSAGAGVPKQFLLLGGKPIYIWSLETLGKHPKIDQIVVVALSQMLGRVQGDIEKYCAPFFDKILVIEGGNSRQASVHCGLDLLARQTKPPTHVLVHDAARPFVSQSDINQVLVALKSCQGCTLAVPVSDTVKRCRDDAIIETVARDELYMVQTPQAADFRILLEAHGQAENAGWQVTDDIALLEKVGVLVKIVLGSRLNFKITNADDLRLAETISFSPESLVSTY